MKNKHSNSKNKIIFYWPARILHSWDSRIFWGVIFFKSTEKESWAGWTFLWPFPLCFCDPYLEAEVCLCLSWLIFPVPSVLQDRLQQRWGISPAQSSRPIWTCREPEHVDWKLSASSCGSAAGWRPYHCPMLLSGGGFGLATRSHICLLPCVTLVVSRFHT